MKKITNIIMDDLIFTTNFYSYQYLFWLISFIFAVKLMEKQITLKQLFIIILLSFGCQFYTYMTFILVTVSPVAGLIYLITKFFKKFGDKKIF